MKINGHQRKNLLIVSLATAVIGSAMLLRARDFRPSPEEGSARFNAARTEIAITRTNCVEDELQKLADAYTPHTANHHQNEFPP